ncbi:uncharacterized protein EI90DRAFT_3119053 [Cantharellus anzutake]|uniref:uncharacterized protein n=1 Tax=Cantharellus anzutake TaxID=1750568 RepID=UPI001908BBC2|nr:uncharacterized protein EI90DRAFT_3119053 [Cantharellus anzutake]KAF8337613.1 hypothetical protein EI90DRAFT_3119053 [Cantharellus anzutake]
MASTVQGVDIPNINNMLGVILVCLIIAAYLFGMSSSQAYIYYDRFPKDPWSYKLLVGVAWAIDTLHTALISHTVYYYTVTHFGDYSSLTTTPAWTFNVEVGLVPLLALIVQLYFAHRSWSIDRKSWPLALAISALAFIQFGFGVAEVAVSFAKVKSFNGLWNYSWLIIVWLSVGAVADLLVTCSLLYSFYKNKTAFADDDGWVTKILMYGLHTGAFTTFTTILNMIFVAAWTHTLVYAGLTYILGKLYTNTMFYVLNRRPVSDPRYASKSGGTSSGSRAKSGHNISSIMPTFAPNRGQNTSTAPRVQPKDPYAPDAEVDVLESGKAPSLTERDEALDIHIDKRSEASYIARDKEPSTNGNESVTHEVPYQ